MKLHNRQSLKSVRRSLRARLTPAEARVWAQLQGGQIAGRKFRRQHSIGPYIVDFYCPGERLVIELDGAAHDDAEAWRRDAARTDYLMAQGVRVIRFENCEVMENLEGVLVVIRGHFTS